MRGSIHGHSKPGLGQGLRIYKIGNLNCTCKRLLNRPRPRARPSSSKIIQFVLLEPRIPEDENEGRWTRTMMKIRSELHSPHRAPRTAQHGQLPFELQALDKQRNNLKLIHINKSPVGNF